LLESGIWRKNGLVESKARESGIPMKIGIQNPSSTHKDWNPVPGIRIRNPRLSWIPLQIWREGAIESVRINGVSVLIISGLNLEEM